MQVQSPRIGIYHPPLMRDLRDDTQLDLGIIGDEQTASFGRDEASSEIPASRYLLDIRRVTAHTAGPGGDLAILRVQPAGLWMEHLGEGAQVGR